MSNEKCNALVRANYHNVPKNIDYTPVYLVRFFQNLLYGEQWELKSRYLHIAPTAEWRHQPNHRATSNAANSRNSSKLLAVCCSEQVLGDSNMAN